MGIKESIQRRTSKVKRTLFDENVKRNGKNLQIIKCSIETEDIFQDKTQTVLQSETLDTIIKFPSEVPLERFRYDNNPMTKETKTFFFDILPIECYTKFSDNIENGDYLIFTFEDENENEIPFVLQISESFGKFEQSLIWKKHYATPANGDIPSELESYISDIFNNKIDSAIDMDIAVIDKTVYYYRAARTYILGSLDENGDEFIFGSSDTEVFGGRENYLIEG